MPLSAFAPRQGGVTLVELLVAMLISLVATIVIFQTLALSEGYKRTSISGGEAQQRGSLALYSVTRDMKQAGFGFNSTPALFGCAMHAYEGVVASARGDFSASMQPLAPVVVIPGGSAATPDSLLVFTGSSAANSGPLFATSNIPVGGTSTTVDNRYGVSLGDVLLIGQTGSDCSIAQVTGLPATPSNRIDFVAPARYNFSTGMPVAYTALTAQIFNLGPRPTLNLYAIDGQHRLVLTNLLQNDAAAATPVVLAESVVQMKAQYGVDNGAGGGTPNDGIIDAFVDPPLGAIPASQVIAVRLAIVARSDQPEKSSSGSAAAADCDTTPADSPSLAWYTTPGPPPVTTYIDVSGASADAACYRYKTFQTVVSLRNMLWRP